MTRFVPRCFILSKAILQALQELLSNIDNKVDIAESSYDIDSAISDILERLETLEKQQAATFNLREKSQTMQSHPSNLFQKQDPPSNSLSVDIRCPHCNCSELSRWGKNKTGDKQRYKCKECGKVFVP